MRIVRISHRGEIRFGVISEDEIVLFEGHPLANDYKTSAENIPLKGQRLLAPTVPSKLVCVGKNYRDHAAEMGGEAPTEPLLFFKPNSSVIGPDDAIVLPEISERVDFEAELTVVIGSVAKHLTPENALAAVWGYTLANDVTARDLQDRDGQWARAKGFDTFCPLGPWIDTDFEPAQQAITTRLNGELKQSGKLNEIIHDVTRILVHASQVMTLLPGDVVLTGTPAGIGQMRAGDRVEVAVEGLGVLSNPVVAASN